MQAVLLFNPTLHDQTPTGHVDVGGLTVSQRALRSAQIAGVEQILIMGEDPSQWSRYMKDEVASRATLTSVQTNARGIAGLLGNLDLVSDEVILLPGDRVIAPKLVKKLVEERSHANYALLDEEGGMIAARLERDALAKLDASQVTTLEHLLEADNLPHIERTTLRDTEFIRVATPADGKRAKALLFKTLKKPLSRQGDGFTAYYINRPVSLTCSRLLVHTPITPNQITTFDLFLGLGAGYLLASGDFLLLAIGAILMQFVSIFDGIDGELARMKLLMSHAGEWYDSVGDDIIKLTMFVGLGLSCYKIFGSEYYLWATGAGAIATIATVAVLYVEILKLGSGTLNSAKWFFEEDDVEPSMWQRILIGIAFVLKRDTYTLLLMLMAAVGLPQISFGLMGTGIAVIFLTTYIQRLSKLVRPTPTEDIDLSQEVSRA